MIRTATRADLPRLLPLLLAANDTPYDIAKVAEEKLFEAGFAGEPVTTVYEEDGALRGVIVTCGRWIRLIAVDPDYRRRGIGSALLADAEARLIAERRLVFAAEAGNYFTPGVPAGDATTIAFLKKHSYREFDDTQNLIAELAGELAVPPQVRRATLDDRPRVLEFINRHFGRVWQFEADHAFRNDPVTLFILEEDGEIAGFSAHEANNRGLGTFGPTGVAPSMRRRGFGSLLLQASLADLHEAGFRETVIPWTDAIEFYKASCGAKPAGAFVTFVK